MRKKKTRTPRPERRRLFRTLTPGSAPGTIVVDPHAHPSVVQVMAYSPEEMVEQSPAALEAVPGLLQKWPVTWVNVDGLGTGSVLEKLQELFNIHRLALEDVVNVHQRPKVEPYPGYLFIILRMLRASERLETEQFSLLLGKNFVLTFQEKPGDCFGAVRERIRTGRPLFRKAGPDYLAYALVDALIDHYFPMLERYDEKLDSLEQVILEKPRTDTIERVHAVRKDLLVLRRAVWPMREAISTLARTDDPLIAYETRVYLRDCYDHGVQILDMLENLREITSSLIELIHSNLSTRMNEIMKVLTLIATIFIPLSFVAGLYGMNFDPEVSAWNMPELGWRFGYPFALGLMAAVAVVMLVWFRRRGWLGGGSSQDPGGP